MERTPLWSRLAREGHDPQDEDLRTRLLAGLGLVAALIVGVCGWAGSAEISSAVIAPGRVVMESSLKKVQHPTGGVVGEIRVKSGDKVTAGDVLMRLDDTQTRANLRIVLSQVLELNGRKVRLLAERDGSQDLDFADSFTNLIAAAGTENAALDIERVKAGEERLFRARRKSAASRKSQLKARIGQLQSEIVGLRKQERAKGREFELVTREMERLRVLDGKKLLPATRILAMERDVTRIEGEHGALLAQIARVGGQISETELQILEVEETQKSDAQRELREVEARLSELTERRIAAEDVLRRVEIRAPRTGMIHELAVHTVGGVIAPGDTLMSIVPDEDRKTIEVRLSPTDIDQVTIGQAALLRFPAFNQRTTPEIKGKIARLASDVTTDPNTGLSYYTARVSVADEEMSKLGKLTLVAGMPVESMIVTGARTALSYMTKPVTDHLARTFREE